MRGVFVIVIVFCFSCTFKAGYCQTSISLCPTSNGTNFCNQLDELIKEVKDSNTNDASEENQAFIGDLESLYELINVEGKMIDTADYSLIIKTCDALIEVADFSAKFDKNGTVTEIKRLIWQNSDANDADSSTTDSASNSDPEVQVAGLKQEQITSQTSESTDQLAQKVSFLENDIDNLRIWLYILVGITVCFIAFIAIVVIQYGKLKKSLEEIRRQQKSNSAISKEEWTSSLTSKSNTNSQNERFNEQSKLITQLQTEIGDLKTSMRLLQKNADDQKKHEATEEKPSITVSKSNQPKVFYHAKFEPSKNGFEIEGNHSYEQENNRTKYKITVTGSEAHLDFIHSEQNTAALSELGQKFLFPLFDIVTPGFDDMKVWKAKKPALLRIEGNYWVIDKKGEI